MGFRQQVRWRRMQGEVACGRADTPLHSARGAAGTGKEQHIMMNSFLPERSPSSAYLMPSSGTRTSPPSRRCYIVLCNSCTFRLTSPTHSAARFPMLCILLKVLRTHAAPLKVCTGTAGCRSRGVRARHERPSTPLRLSRHDRPPLRRHSDPNTGPLP